MDAIFVLYEAFIKSAPDAAFELHSSTIRVYADGTSTIVAKFTMIATKVFAITGLEENGDHKVVLSLDPVDELSKKFGQAQLTAKITATVDDPLTGLTKEVDTETKMKLGPVHKNKSKVAVIGTLHMYLNADKKAFRLLFSQWNDESKAESEKAAGVDSSSTNNNSSSSGVSQAEAGNAQKNDSGANAAVVSSAENSSGVSSDDSAGGRR